MDMILIKRTVLSSFLENKNLDEVRLKNILPKKVLTIQILCDIL